MKKGWGTAGIGLLILYLLFAGNRGLWNLYKLHEEKQTLTEQVVQLQSDIARYQEQYRALEKAPSILEKQAREELNLVKPDEIVFKFKNAKHQ